MDKESALVIKEALDKAFHFGARTADGYLQGLLSFNSVRTLASADEDADRVRKIWPSVRDKMVEELNASL